MKLKELYEKIYDKIFSIGFFAKFLKIPGVKKLLQYEVISYLVFGALATAVNFIVFYLANLPFGENYKEKVLFSVGGLDIKWIYVSNALAWFSAAMFAFITNKLLVFESKSKKIGTVIRELLSFFGARIASLLLFEELLFGLLDHAFRNYPQSAWIAKVLVSVFVIVFNYAASKLVIFRKKTEGGDEKC